MSSSSEITREAMMESLGAPPLFREDLEQAITPPTSDERRGTFVTVTRDRSLDSKKHSSEADSGNVVEYNCSDRTSHKAPPRYTQANGALPASLSSFMKTQSEHGASVKKSSEARVAHPWQSQHVPSANQCGAQGRASSQSYIVSIAVFRR
jgi:hypothetical protein